MIQGRAHAPWEKDSTAGLDETGADHARLFGGSLVIRGRRRRGYSAPPVGASAAAAGVVGRSVNRSPSRISSTLRSWKSCRVERWPIETTVVCGRRSAITR